MTETRNKKNTVYQQNFLNWLTALDAENPKESRLAAELQPAFVHRLRAYQESYLGRVTANLSESLFESCEKLFGRDFVIRMLAHFFKTYPPHAAALTSAADALPAALRAASIEREVLLFADVAEVCIARWQILTGPDPEEHIRREVSDLSYVFLRTTTRYIRPSGRHDLAAAWHRAQHENSAAAINDDFFSSKTGVLLAKSTATDFHVIDVPEAIDVLVSELSSGNSVGNAVEKLDSANTETFDNQDFENLETLVQNFMQTISQLGILTESR